MRASLDDARLRAAVGGERARVLQLLKAVQSGNWTLIARVVRAGAQSHEDDAWTEAGLLAVRLWLADVLGDQENYYSHGERFGLDRRIPRRQLVLAFERSSTKARPSLVVATVVMALMGY